MARKPQAGELVASPNVIPMADIMLVLLIIFLVVTPMIHPYAAVNQAAVSNPKEMADASREDALVVAVARDGSTYLGSQKMDRERLADSLKAKLAERRDKTVFLNCDRSARYADVVATVEQIRTAGVEQIGLLTEKITRKTSAPVGG